MGYLVRGDIGSGAASAIPLGDGVVINARAVSPGPHQ